MNKQPLSTYRIRYRRPNSDGADGYEGPEFDVREITAALCEGHGNAYDRPGAVGKGSHYINIQEWDSRGTVTGVCDMCARPGVGLFTILIERALGV
jgi:hypothetical protein